MYLVLDELADSTIPYNTYFKEGNMACDMSLGFLDKTIGDDVSTCRKRCDWNPKCMFFYHQLFGDNECVLLSSCSKYITKRSSGATYVKQHPGNLIDLKHYRDFGMRLLFAVLENTITMCSI